MNYSERQEHWEWCRQFIDREAIYRANEKHPKIPSKKPGGFYQWQIYLRRATFNAEFAHRLGLLFWEHFQSKYETQPFQICACIPSGPPIGMAIQNYAFDLGIPVNLFFARREAKRFGTDSWFEGRGLGGVPVVIVDDVAASTEYMKLASARIQLKLGLSLHQNYFTIINKVGEAVDKNSQHTENYLDNDLVSLFTMNNFNLSPKEYQWTGVVR